MGKYESSISPIYSLKINTLQWKFLVNIKETVMKFIAINYNTWKAFWTKYALSYVLIIFKCYHCNLFFKITPILHTSSYYINKSPVLINILGALFLCSVISSSTHCFITNSWRGKHFRNKWRLLSFSDKTVLFHTRYILGAKFYEKYKRE